MEKGKSDLCEYCHERPAFKTNGKSELICENMADYGKCEGPTPIVSLPKIGRNEICPCGSGKKFKKCCSVPK